MASVELRGLVKRFGSFVAVDDVSLTIDHGQLVCLLGPSGCGKTTTLRLIAGFLEPSDGEIRVGDRVVSSKARTLPPEPRTLLMTFQSYALWPHTTVAEHTVYGLRLRKMDRDTIAKTLAAILATTKLEPLAQRYPGEPSGGQQQRVALARAIVIAPRVLLCDEPLGALDKKLRQQMQFELKQLQKKLGLTLVFVTHDQEEALAMSDRIAVMNGGRVEQVGTPTEIYNQPTTRFVADFIGDTNIFRGERTTTSAGASALDVGKGLILALPSSEAQGTGVLSVALRPEKIRLIPRADATAAGSSAHGTVENTNFLGGAVLYRITLEGGHRVLVQQPNAGTSRLFVPGNGVTLDWTPADLVVLKD